MEEYKEKTDIEALRKDLIEYFEGAYFASGFGASLVESIDLYYADIDEVIRIAINYGFCLNNYFKDDEYNKKLN